MGIFVPHGMAPGYWIPESPRLDSGKMLSIMEPLDKVVDASGKVVHESFLDQTVILSGMWTKSAEPPAGVTGADHWVAAAYMCAKKPKKATGADIEDVGIGEVVSEAKSSIFDWVSAPLLGGVIDDAPTAERVSTPASPGVESMSVL